MIDHLLPPWLLGRDARDDLTLIFSFIAALTVVGAVLGWFWRQWATRITATYGDGTKTTTLIVGQNPLRIVVKARKADLLYKVNVACLDRERWRYRRAPRDVIRVRDLLDENDPGNGVIDADGSASFRYQPPAAKGKRPIGLTMGLDAACPWSGWLSVRDETTSKTTRLRLRVVEKPSASART